MKARKPKTITIIYRPASDLRRSVTLSRAKYVDIYYDRKLVHREEFRKIQLPFITKERVVRSIAKVFTEIFYEPPKPTKKKKKKKKLPKLKEVIKKSLRQFRKNR